jgi:hypothetical protein
MPRLIQIILVLAIVVVGIGIVSHKLSIRQTDPSRTKASRTALTPDEAPNPDALRQGASSPQTTKQSRDSRVLLAARMFAEGNHDTAKEYLATLARDGETLAVRADAAELLSSWIERSDNDLLRIVALLEPIWNENLPSLTEGGGGTSGEVSLSPDALGTIANRLALAYAHLGQKAESWAIYESMLDHPEQFPRYSLTTMAVNSGSTLRMSGDVVRAERLVTRALMLWQNEKRIPNTLRLAAYDTYLDGNVRLSADATAWLRDRWAERDAASPADAVLTGMAYVRGLSANSAPSVAADVAMETIMRLRKSAETFRTSGDPLLSTWLDDPESLEIRMLSDLTGAGSYGRRDAALWAHERLIELAKTDEDHRQAVHARDVFVAQPN